jgi:hypothetical protein
MLAFVRVALIATVVSVAIWSTRPAVAAGSLLEFALEAAEIAGVGVACESKETRNKVVAWIVARATEGQDGGILGWFKRLFNLQENRFFEIAGNSDQLESAIVDLCMRRPPTKEELRMLREDLRHNINDNLAKILELRKFLVGNDDPKLDAILAKISGSGKGGLAEEIIKIENELEELRTELRDRPPPRVVNPRPRHLRSGLLPVPRTPS